jgi:hypothetical protein
MAHCASQHAASSEKHHADANFKNIYTEEIQWQRLQLFWREQQELCLYALKEGREKHPGD